MTAPFAPQFLAPSAPGQLSNFRGSNTLLDAIGFKTRYANPKGVANPLSLIRVQTFRSGVSGAPSSPQSAWDSGWIGGTPAVQQLLLPKQACGGNSTAIYNSRLYFMPSDGQLMSAPIGSAAVGSWRYENPLPISVPGTPPTVYAMTQVAGRLYCTASSTSYLSSAASLYVANINPDGTLGTWQIVPGGIVTQSDATWKNVGICGFWDGKSTTGFIVIWNGTTVNTVAVNVSDGSITTALATSVTATASRDNLSAGVVVVTAGVGWVFLIGGSAATATAAVDGQTVNTTTGIISGNFVAKQVLPAVRTGGTLIALQNNTIYYMGGSSTNLAVNATNTVYYNSVANILGAVAWTASAQTLPQAAWLLGGGITMPDYDLLSSAKTPDNIVEKITTTAALNSSAACMAIASFKVATAYAIVGVAGAVAIGSNVAVGPATGGLAFGQATVAGHDLFAYVSGSDHTAGTPGQSLGQTGAATSTFDFSGVNSDNIIFTGASYTVPAGGILITAINVYMGGYSANVDTTLCVWNASTGAQIVAGTTATYGVGLSLRTQSISSVFVAAGTTIYIGFFRQRNQDAQWGVAASGSFNYLTNQTSSNSISGFSGCTGPYTCGDIQAYITYTTVNAPTPITTASVGWLKAADSPNGDEEVQIWYKPNCGTAETAPTFTTAGGSSPMFAQLIEFSGGVTGAPVDQNGVFAQGAAATSMTVANGGNDAAQGELVLTVSRWSLASTATATFSDVQNNGANVNVGNTGGVSRVRHSSFNYSITPVSATPTRSPYVVVIAGQSTAGATQTTVNSAAVNPANNPSDLRAWLTNVAGTATSAGSLGGAASLVANADGTQDVTVNYGALGVLNEIAAGTVFIAGFNDGDQVTITVQTVGTDGDPSPLSTSVIKIGQAPTITNIGPNGATIDGRPILLFSYNPGAGGDLELSYRIQLAPNGFDSGVRYDSANSVTVLSAPYLASTVQQTITVTIVSKDIPMPGSTATTVATGTFTPTVTAPGTPTVLTVTPNHALGLVALAWTNNTPAGTTPGNRIYYRRNGTSAWFLLFDSLTAITAFNALDQLALNVGYDFAVSQVDNNTHSESPLSNIVLNVSISSITGVYTVFLHIAGQGAAHFAPLLVEVSPEIKARFDVRLSTPFQQLAPTARFGVHHYALIVLPAFITNLATQKQLMDLIAVAYQGNPIYYRDSFGGMVTVTLDPEQSEVYRPLTVRNEKINLTQIANTFQPSALQGSAQGYLAQLFGSVTPLDPSESLL